MIADGGFWTCSRGWKSRQQHRWSAVNHVLNSQWIPERPVAPRQAIFDAHKTSLQTCCPFAPKGAHRVRLFTVRRNTSKPNADSKKNCRKTPISQYESSLFLVVLCDVTQESRSRNNSPDVLIMGWWITNSSTCIWVVIFKLCEIPHLFSNIHVSLHV